MDIYEQTHESLKALLAEVAAKEMAALRGGAGAAAGGSRKRPASAVAAGGGGGGGGDKWEYRGPDGQVSGLVVNWLWLWWCA